MAPNKNTPPNTQNTIRCNMHIGHGDTIYSYSRKCAVPRDKAQIRNPTIEILRNVNIKKAPIPLSIGAFLVSVYILSLEYYLQTCA